jgi:hypothetical protein
LRTPIDEAVARVKALPWDSESALVNLTRRDGEHALALYLHGAVSGQQIEPWASALERRDDVGLEPGYELLLKSLLFELATPEMTRPLTVATARDWATRLAAAPRA